MTQIMRSTVINLSDLGKLIANLAPPQSLGLLQFCNSAHRLQENAKRNNQAESQSEEHIEKAGTAHPIEPEWHSELLSHLAQSFI